MESSYKANSSQLLCTSTKRLLLLLSITVSLDSFARFSYGVNGTGQISWTSTAYWSNSPRTGFAAGMWMKAGGTHKLFGMSYLNYSLKGNACYRCNFNLNYITNAYMVGAYLTRKVSIVVGPEISYLLSAVTVADNIRFDGTGAFRRWNIGITGGGRYDLTSRWSVGYSYTHGLVGNQKPVYYFYGGSQTTDNKYNERNRVHTISLFYRIH